MINNNIFRIITGHRFEVLEQFSEEVESFINSKFDEFKQQAIKDTEGYSEDEEQEYYDHFYDDLVLVRDDYPSLLRYQTITTAHSLLEETLMDIYNQHSKGAAGYKKYKKRCSLISALIEYMRREMNINIPASPVLEFINNLTKVRNNIVHCNGYIFNDQHEQRLERIISSSLFLKSNSGKIVVGKEYITEMLKNIDSLLDTIIDNWENDKSLPI